jgi:hypothetical protein
MGLGRTVEVLACILAPSTPAESNVGVKGAALNLLFRGGSCVSDEINCKTGAGDSEVGLVVDGRFGDAEESSDDEIEVNDRRQGTREQQISCWRIHNCYSFLHGGGQFRPPDKVVPEKPGKYAEIRWIWTTSFRLPYFRQRDWLVRT